MSSWFDGLLAWISAHPHAAGAAIFAVAFCDALILVGAVVPALPLLLPVGILIGMGELSGPYALGCAALGALLGDGISYWVGRRWGARLYDYWPFSKYPELLQRGELQFRRNSIKSILIARFVGPIRPFVPAVAGMAGMPPARYLPTSAVAAISWAALFLLPGWVFGQAYDAVAAVAGRLALVLGLLTVALALAWVSVLYSYRWFAMHADALLARALSWSNAHPVLGAYSQAIFDPRRRESVSLGVLAVLLLVLGWACFGFLAVVLGHGEPLAIDLAVHEFMQGLRNPLADPLLAALATLGDWQVITPAIVLVLTYLLWRKRWLAACHWIAALAFGLALTTWLGAVVDIPKPPAVSSGFGFPSIAITMITITFGFFAVLIARELPGRDRIWPYMLAGLAVTSVGFSRLYLGAHWFSDVVGGTLLGTVWLLLLGIAYRLRVRRSLWMVPLAWLFYGAFLVAALWHAPRSIDTMLARFEAKPTMQTFSPEAWWQQDWQRMPARRSEFDNEQRWPLDVQVAGPLLPLRQVLEAAGWRAQPQAGWQDALQLLDDDIPAGRQPVLPASLDSRAEALLMLRSGTRPGELYALRLWPAPATLQSGSDDALPLWIGSAQVLRHRKEVFGLVNLWQPQSQTDTALEAVTLAVSQLPSRMQAHPDSAHPVLRIRTDETRLEP